MPFMAVDRYERIGYADFPFFWRNECHHVPEEHRTAWQRGWDARNLYPNPKDGSHEQQL
jgi:hypothetical protein